MADDEGSERTNASKLLPRPRVHGEPARPKKRSVESTAAIDREQPGDYTKLIIRHRNRILLGVAATVVGAALIVTLALLPIRTWFSQNDEVKKGQIELDALNAANAIFEAQNQRLQTSEGIKDEARKTLGLVDAKEKKSPLLPPPTLSPQLPAGLPYSLVTDILTVRTNQAASAATAAAAATTVPFPTTSPGTTQSLITTAEADRANQTGQSVAPDVTDLPVAPGLPDSTPGT